MRTTLYLLLTLAGYALASTLDYSIAVAEANEARPAVVAQGARP